MPRFGVVALAVVTVVPWRWGRNGLVFGGEIKVTKMPGGYELTVFSSKDGAPPPE